MAEKDNWVEMVVIGKFIRSRWGRGWDSCHAAPVTAPRTTNAAANEEQNNDNNSFLDLMRTERDRK